MTNQHIKKKFVLCQLYVVLLEEDISFPHSFLSFFFALIFVLLLLLLLSISLSEM